MKQTTLVFLRHEGKILLALKKRGFGHGKWNGTGGKLEPGELPLQAAIRETEEEIGVTPKNLQPVGELLFFDLPHTKHYCYFYVATEWEGEPHETEEMSPKWFKEAEIPYNEMWPDDKFWMPLLLAGKKFRGTVTVENDRLTQHSIEEVGALQENDKRSRSSGIG
jgi:8-oxo-dGTP diphosphatase